MRTTFLPFSRPDITESDIQAVGSVLRSGWITTGPQCARLEEDFKAYVGCADAVAMTSETGVIQTLFRALNLGPGDEVITPAMTWVSLPNIAALAGVKVVFADVDRDTLMVDAAMIEEKITERTKLIAPVHFAGAALNLGELRRLAQKYHVALVEDAAHALGTAWNGEKVGSRGSAMFSFHPIKNITTGEGGMFATGDLELGRRIRSLRFHGLGVDAYDRKTQGRAPQAEVVEPGYKFNLPDMQAALGIGQLARVDAMNAKRRSLAMRYREMLAGIDELLPLRDPTYPMTHSWHLFAVRLDIDRAKMTRDHFMAELKRRNIGTGLHFRCVHLQKYYREVLGHRPGELPNTEWNSDRILSLPLFPDMTELDQDDVLEAVKDVLAQR